MANTTFKRGKYKPTNFIIKGLHFSKIYMEQRVWMKYLLVIAVGVIFALTGHFFIKKCGAYTYGLSCLVQGIARFTSFEIYFNNPGMSEEIYNMIFTALFWGLIFVANIPLFIFSGIKIGRRFTLLSLVFLAVSTVVGFCLGITPVIKDVNIFGDTTLTGSAPWIQELGRLKVEVLPFSPVSVEGYDPSNYAKPFMLMLSTLTYALLTGVAFAILYIVGGSTSGTDFISVYLAKRKNRPISGIFFIVNVCCIVIGATLGTFTPAAIACQECRSYQFFFSANLIGTVASLAIFTTIFAMFFPRSKKYKIEVNSKKAAKIKQSLKTLSYPHPTNLKTENNITTLNTVCSTMELSLLLQTINKVDNKAMVIVTKIAYYGGPLDTYQIGSD